LNNTPYPQQNTTWRCAWKEKSTLHSILRYMSLNFMPVLFWRYLLRLRLVDWSCLKPVNLWSIHIFFTLLPCPLNPFSAFNRTALF
jgi:hypothetical protein